MKKKKLLSITLVMCLMITLFAGCGSTKTEPSSSAGGQSTETASAAGSGTAEAGTEPESSLLGSLPEAVGAGVEIAASPELYAATDLSKEYTVNMYLIGDTPNDWDKVLALVNEYLEPYNTKLAVTVMSWSDYQTMYSLVLAAFQCSGSYGENRSSPSGSYGKVRNVGVKELG